MRPWHLLLSGAACAGLLTGCAGTTTGGDCTSFYEEVAQAPTRAALLDELVDTTPRARSTLAVGRHDGKRTVNVLNAKRHVVVQVDTWRLDDGSWTARVWHQCID